MKPTDQDVLNSIIDFVKIKAKDEKSLIFNTDLSKITFIPSNPYDSKEISAEKGNLWELGECWPFDQEIKIIIKP
jgi:hypothetical protein